MNQEEMLDFQEMLSKTEGLLIPRIWMYNICDPDPSIPFDEEDETGMTIGSMLASIFNLYGFPKDAEDMYPILAKLINENKQILIDKAKLMKSIGVTSKEQIEQALNRAEKWSLITIHKKEGKLYCSLNEQAINQEHCVKMKTLSHQKLNVYEETNV
ncbi:MAG: hypothetical protein B7C24_17450 [Bacteroidetes bacterium 4572_77]|nr:MAG: hypothetical protein B7C24_17450 [Bacteroidetes bacterium 4572_77]